MGLARRAQGARRRRCRRTSLTTSNAEITPQLPCALRVPAARGQLGRGRSSTMYRDIACVAPPCICPRGTRNAAPPNSRTGSWPAIQNPKSCHHELHGYSAQGSQEETPQPSKALHFSVPKR